MEVKSLLLSKKVYSYEFKAGKLFSAFFVLRENYYNISFKKIKRLINPKF